MSMNRDALEAVAELSARGTLQEALGGGLFDPSKHQRDWRGRFKEKLGALQPGEKVQLPKGVTIERDATLKGNGPRGENYVVRQNGSFVAQSGKAEDLARVTLPHLGIGASTGFDHPLDQMAKDARASGPEPHTMKIEDLKAEEAKLLQAWHRPGATAGDKFKAERRLTLVIAALKDRGHSPAVMEPGAKPKARSGAGGMGGKPPSRSEVARRQKVQRDRRAQTEASGGTPRPGSTASMREKGALPPTNTLTTTSTGVPDLSNLVPKSGPGSYAESPTVVMYRTPGSGPWKRKVFKTKADRQDWMATKGGRYQTKG